MVKSKPKNSRINATRRKMSWKRKDRLTGGFEGDLDEGANVSLVEGRIVGCVGLAD